MKIENKRIVDLLPAKYNPRKELKPGNKEYEKLKKSIIEFGYVDLVIWNEQTGHVVGGHQRLTVLKDLGYQEIDVVVVSLSLEKEKALNIGLNKISGEWDAKKLEDLLGELAGSGMDMDVTGFGELELDDLLNTRKEIKEDNFDVDVHLSEADEVISKRGDLWQLGNHRLLCGDSTKLEDMQKLMGDDMADMVFTDPPYNVAYTGKTKDALTIENDSMSDSNFYAFLYDCHAAMFAVTKPGGALYVCHADSEGVNFRTAYKNTGWDLKQCLIWVKNTIVMGRQDHHWKHEPILYGWKPGASHKWTGDRKQSTVMKEENAVVFEKLRNGKHKITVDIGTRTMVIEVPEYELITEVDDSLTSVWYFDKPVKNTQHPTMKPIAIPARAMKNSSEPGDIVLDAFGGSGSTLIAAEQIGRHARLMEYDPKYCDVIVKRWEEYTGGKAVLLNAEE